MKMKFSESPMWQWQQAYFKNEGIDAWRNLSVPHYITSNPFISKTYAEIMIAFLRDLSSKKNTGETVYILELGAGHGRFCYHFFKHLETFIETAGQKLPPFCYVLSDMAEENVQHWKTHPRLQPYIQKGWLDMAIVDAGNIDAISLQVSGKQITTGSLAQPLVVIANYFFDTIPQELFFIDEQKIRNGLIEIKDGENIFTMEPAYFVGGEVTHPYAEPWLATVLNGYRDTLSKAFLLFPHVGINCLHRLQHLSAEGIFLLTADKGSHRKEEVGNAAPPEPVKHGSFSFPVNYHAIKIYCQHCGGMALFPTQTDFDLTVGALLFLNDPQQYSETVAAYDRFVNDFGPDDFFSLKKMFNKHNEEMSLRDLMAALRLSGYDARYFEQIIQRLYDYCTTPSEKEKWMLFQTVHRVWDMYYPLGEAYDLASGIGELLYRLKFYSESIVYFMLSNRLYGERIYAMYNIALCHFYTGNKKEAERMIGRVLEKDASHTEALYLAGLLNED